MFPPPRVIVIDDERAHLNGLVDGLNRRGVASLPVLFEEGTQIPPCPDVRVIFADLHLGPGGLSSSHKPDFSTINSLLENDLRPAGPYFILLWTAYPEQAQKLRDYLDERLEGVKKPFDVAPLAKADHLDANGNVKDEDKLLAEIDSIAGGLPQIGALFNWENRVLRATGDTVSSLLEFTSAEEADQRLAKLKRILATLGIEAVGEKHVDDDRFRAVNEALLPILADRIANPRFIDDADAVWTKAFDTESDASVSEENAAKLNRFVHLSDPGSAHGAGRGAVISLPEEIRTNFEGVFDMDQRNAAGDQFRCKDFEPDDDRFRWLLVQCQAACDHAQSQPGPLPFHLGLDFPEANRSKGKNSHPPPCGRVRGSSSTGLFDCCASAPAFRFHCLPPRFGASIRSIGCASSFSTTSSITFMPTAADRA